MVYTTENVLNPITKSNFICRSLFLFTIPIFRKRHIKENDIYQTLESYKSDTLGDLLETEWKKEKCTKKPSLARALLKLFYRPILLLGLFVFVVDFSSSIVKPLVVGKIVKFFDFNEKPSQLPNGTVYCCILIGWLLFTGVLTQIYTFQIALLMLRIKIACSTLVYRKLIRTTVIDCARGQAITLITKDVNSADVALFIVFQMVIGLAQVAVLTYIMYIEVGISALIGMSFLILYFPCQALLGRAAVHFRLRTATLTDIRIKKIQEVLAAIRNIKLYAWESFHIDDIKDSRKNEVAYIGWTSFLQAVAFALGQFELKLIFCVIILTYVNFGHTLTAEKVFTVTTSLQGLNSLIQIFTPVSVNEFGNAISAINRLNNFLNADEVISNICAKRTLEQPIAITAQELTIKQGHITVLNSVNFSVTEGLTLLKGQTGVGKTTLLHALLGEAKTLDGRVKITGSVSFASQEPWIFPSSIKQNILFGEAYDEFRYKTVIRVCGLEKDIQFFSNGDLTCVTDRGLNLSKGQRTRINLARCVYKNTDIYLLDDCLSSLDNLVANQIFYQCIKVFLKNKICVFVTHNEIYTKDADHILVINNGNLVLQTYDGEHKMYVNIIQSSNDTDLENDTAEKAISSLKTNKNKLKKLNTFSTTNDDHKDFNEEGAVTKKVYRYYFSSGGGSGLLFVIVVLLMAASQAMDSWASYFVSIWVAAEELKFQNATEHKLEQPTTNTSEQYFSIVAASLIVLLIGNTAFVFFTYIASVNIHNCILQNIFKATMCFFDTNPPGNVLNKLSRDISIVDEQLPSAAFIFLQILLLTVAALALISSVQVYLFVPSLLLLVILYLARFYYLPTSRSIRRLQGSTRAPVIGHLNTTADGLTTIRANQMQDVAITDFERHQDLYNSVMHMTISTQSAFLFILDILCTCYVGITTFAMCVLKESLLSAEVGLAITQSLSISGHLLKYGVSCWAELENRMTSVERLLPYTKVIPEKHVGECPLDWPVNGTIHYKDVSLTYPLTQDTVLSNITFQIDSKKKLGIVGRTGAGKTSLISVLFRLYDYTGSITIDGVEIRDINLKHLRSQLSIIPQDPYFFTGTIRQNLDPCGRFSDEEIWQALEDVEMKTMVNTLAEKISGDCNIFSIGQKQLLCLARAMLQKNAILVLDEATSNLDADVDKIIQKVVRTRFPCATIITIAHRLCNIINNDIILVIDNGKIVELGDPKKLCKNENGIFYAMLKDSGIAECSKL